MWGQELRQVSGGRGEGAKEGANGRVTVAFEVGLLARAFLEVQRRALAVAVRARGKGEVE
jgi:hypothetical protein